MLSFLFALTLFNVRAESPSPTVGPALYCEQTLLAFGGKNLGNKSDDKVLKEACQTVQVLDGCSSVAGTPIFHFDKKGSHKSNQKILVFSLIHGDELPAGNVGRFWMERLQGIDPRNSWRVVPVLNPDGLKAKTRTNGRGVDINRNFPTTDWEKSAKAYWERDSKKSPRRFPGDKAASEPETQCALKHIIDFKPDFVVSIHTPLKVLDFDGPRAVKPPKFDYLPWKSLGNYPGSLGRYLWHERKTPVLTAEFKEDQPPEKPLVELQDIVGFLVSLEIKDKAEAKPTPETKGKAPSSADPAPH